MYKSIPWVQTLLLALALGITSWQVLAIIHKKPKHVPTDEYHGDNFADIVHIKTFDESGYLVKQLFTEGFVHYPINDTFIFKAPRITLHKKNTLTWIISAKEGRSNHNNSRIQFNHHVHLKQPPGANKVATHMDTESLTYYPKKHLAQTDNTLTLKQPGIILRSQGMTINFITQRINLLADTQGTYLPREAPPSLKKKVKKTLEPIYHV